MIPRRRIAFLLPAAAVLAAVLLLPSAAGQEPPCDAAGSPPPDPACGAGPPAEDAPRAVSGSAPPSGFHPALDRPNPSNTTLSAPARPVVGEPFTVVLATALPETIPVVYGNGTLGEIALPDAYHDEADTSVAIRFGGELAVLSSDPALGAPLSAGNGTRTEIAGTVSAEPGREYRFELSLLPMREGTAAIDAAGFAQGADRLVLDVVRGAAQGNGSRAGPDPGNPPERKIPDGGGPAGGAVRGGGFGGDAAAGHAVPADAGAGRGRDGTERAGGAPPRIAPAEGGAGARGHSGAPSQGGGDLALSRAPAEPAPEPEASSQNAQDLVLYGQIRHDPPHSDAKPARGLKVCVERGAGRAGYGDGTAPCAFTNEYGLYVLGPLTSAHPTLAGAEPELGLAIYASDEGATVVGPGGSAYRHHEDYRYYGGEYARIDVAVPYNHASHIGGAARIAGTIEDARAFFEEELGVAVPHVRVYWEPGKRAADLWPRAAGGSGPSHNPNHPEIFLDSSNRYAIQHEYARHVHNHLGAAPEGCAHNFTAKVPPGCAFAEGFAHFVPHLVDGTPYLFEGWQERDGLFPDFGRARAYVDIERELHHVGPVVHPLFGYDGSPGGQTVMQVAGALWDVHDGPADETHDRKRKVVGGRTVTEGGILDDVRAGAGGIVRTLRDGPQSIGQFHAMWEESGRESLRNVMDLHRMPPGNPAAFPWFSPVAAVRVDHAGEAAVALSAVLPGGGNAPLDVVGGFYGGRVDYGHAGAAVSDNGNGTGTLLLRPARADVGENVVTVRVNHSGQAALARVNVTVTEPPKWAPVQANYTFDRGLADWLPGRGGVWPSCQAGEPSPPLPAPEPPECNNAWGIVQTADPSSPHLAFGSANHGHITTRRGIDATAYESASLTLRFGAPDPRDAGSRLSVYAVGHREELLGSWDVSDAAPAGFRTETVGLPASLLLSDDLKIRIYARKSVPTADFRILVDDVVLTGARGTGPAIEAPGDAAAEAAAPGNSTAVRLGEPRADPAGLAVAHEPRGPFPPGTTAVTWTATDAATGESDSDVQLVTVRDATPPTVTPPADYTVRAPGDTAYLSPWDYCSAAAEDAVSDAILLGTVEGAGPYAAPPARGYSSGFPVGETTTVTWIAMDHSGNTATAEQDVTVVSSEAAATQLHTVQPSAAQFLPGTYGRPHDPAWVTYVWAGSAEPPAPGSAMPIHVAFSRPVALTAAYAGEEPGSLRPSLAMAGGGRAEYESGNGTSVLTFSHEVRAGEDAPDYEGEGALGGPCTVRGAADNRGARMGLPDPGEPGLPPPAATRVVRVSTYAGWGVHGEGDVIPIEVEFSGPVAVEGSPRLLLDVGAPGAAAEYAGSTSPTSLLFEYEVRAGDASPDLDYTGTGALALNGGSIMALGKGEAASPVLPEPSAEPGLLDGTWKLVVGTKPHVDVGVFARSTGYCDWHPDYRDCAWRGRLWSSELGGLWAYEPGADYRSAGAARRGANDFNSLSAERGYPVFVNVTRYGFPDGGEGPGGVRNAEEALRAAHAGGEGPMLYVGPASDRALHGMEEYAAENGITMISHSSAARSLAKADGIYRLDPGTGHMARVLAHMLAGGGFDAVVPVVQEDLYGTGAGGDPFEYGLLGSLRHDLEPAGVRVERQVGFEDAEGAAGAVRALEAAVLAAGVAGEGRNVAVLYVGSDVALAKMAEGVGANSPIVGRSAWFAVGGAGAGVGTGVAASPLIASDAEALALARWTGLAAV